MFTFKRACREKRKAFAEILFDQIVRRCVLGNADNKNSLSCVSPQNILIFKRAGSFNPQTDCGARRSLL